MKTTLFLLLTTVVVLLIVHLNVGNDGKTTLETSERCCNNRYRPRECDCSGFTAEDKRADQRFALTAGLCVSLSFSPVAQLD